VLDLRVVSYDHPDPVALTELAQRFYVQIYGSPDDSPFTVEEFAPPHGTFLVGYLDGRPVAMGGWRFSSDAVAGAARPAEIKRMFVREELRGRGLAREILSALEISAHDAGADWMILETGQPQVAAVAFYRACGYAAVDRFGHYADSPKALHLGKPLR
jgi:GNAT superfamily N-acetyltransferase